MESTEVQLARMDERLKMVLQKMEENHESHVRSRAWMSAVDRTLEGISSRVTNVEASLANNAPTIQEFIEIKHKVIGAGMAGRWIWVGAGTIIGLLVSFREAIFRFFTGAGA
jgi:hypothetical protein